MSPADRERHIAYYDRTARAAYSHCCSILIGCSRRPCTQANSATGVFVLVNEHHYLLTASHVIDGFANKLAKDPPAHFQVGNLVVNPLNRLVFQDSKRDLAVIAIDNREVADIVHIPYRPVDVWPPAMPNAEAFVQLTGFAAANRINHEPDRIESFSLHMTGHVMPANDGVFFVRIERDGIATDEVHLAVPPGESLGGMSGGPVMLFFAEPLPLVGIISAMSELMDSIRVSALTDLHLPHRGTAHFI